MPLDIAKLEDFFETKFEEFEQFDPAQGVIRELFHFDSSAHWHVFLDESRHFLRFASGPFPVHGTYPSTELEVFYSSSNLHVSLRPSGETDLMIRPQGCSVGANWLVFTKFTNGRISLSTTIGEVPGDDRDSFVNDSLGSSTSQ